MHHPAVRPVWDHTDMETLEVVDVVDQMVIYYQKQKQAYSFISARDFLEKKIIFRDDKATYVFISSIPDEFLLNDLDVIRAYTIVGFQRYEKLEDGSIQYQSVLQSDFNAGSGILNRIGQAAAISAMPSAMNKWWANWTENAKSLGKYADYDYKKE